MGKGDLVQISQDGRLDQGPGCGTGCDFNVDIGDPDRFLDQALSLVGPDHPDEFRNDDLDFFGLGIRHCIQQPLELSGHSGDLFALGQALDIVAMLQELVPVERAGIVVLR